VVRPVGGAVAGGLGLAHAARLTAWIRNVNPSWREFCNNAYSRANRSLEAKLFATLLVWVT
ncbi:hypothetical protein, partial [Salipiger bermudensis]|uniref:hypothetical protein n=1 Tax=Salipiger bermudensis TaxID=344736 RepID=UPI001CD780F0